MRKIWDAVAGSFVLGALTVLLATVILTGCLTACQTTTGQRKGVTPTTVKVEDFAPVEYDPNLYQFQPGCSEQQMNKLVDMLHKSQHVMCECFEGVYGKKLQLVTPQHQDVVPFKRIEIYPFPFPLSGDKDMMVSMEVMLVPKMLSGQMPGAEYQSSSGDEDFVGPPPPDTFGQEPLTSENSDFVLRIRLARGQDGMWDFSHWALANHLMFRFWTLGEPMIDPETATDEEKMRFILAHKLCIEPLLPQFDPQVWEEEQQQLREREREPHKKQYATLDHMAKLPKIRV